MPNSEEASISPFRKCRLIPGLLQLGLRDALPFTLTIHVSSFSLHCRLDCHRLDSTEKFTGDRGIDTVAAEREASRLAEHQVGLVTPIDGLSRRAPRVAHHQAPSAAATGDQPDQQRAAPASRFWASCLAVGVDRELLLVPLELRPVDVAVVVILEQNLPLLKRFVVAVALAGATVDDLRAFFTFAVGVSACIEWVLQLDFASFWASGSRLPSFFRGDERRNRIPRLGADL